MRKELTGYKLLQASTALASWVYYRIGNVRRLLNHDHDRRKATSFSVVISRRLWVDSVSPAWILSSDNYSIGQRYFNRRCWSRFCTRLVSHIEQLPFFLNFFRLQCLLLFMCACTFSLSLYANVFTCL